MIEITFIFFVTTFMAGVLMFLAPCTLPLVPGFLSFIAGGTATKTPTWCRVVGNTAWYCVGFSLTFTLLGVAVAWVGSGFGYYQIVFSQIAGVVVMLFGLMLLGVIPIRLLQHNYRAVVPKSIVPGTTASAFMLGVVFALGWTPCVGPILASILFLAASSGTVIEGGLLLLVFSAGMSIPFMVVALVYNRSLSWLERHSRALRLFELLGGLFLVGIGLLMLSNNFLALVDVGTHLYEQLQFGFILDQL